MTTAIAVVVAVELPDSAQHEQCASNEEIIRSFAVAMAAYVTWLSKCHDEEAVLPL